MAEAGALTLPEDEECTDAAGQQGTAEGRQRQPSSGTDRPAASAPATDQRGGRSRSPSCDRQRHRPQATPAPPALARPPPPDDLTARSTIGTSPGVQTTPPADPPKSEGEARLVLASASPRRREILASAKLAFEIQPAEIEERARAGETPQALAERLAREKALEVARRLPPSPRRPVLGADTIVVAPDGDVLGKPRDEAHAVRLLERLVGHRHRVMTGIALAWSGSSELQSRVVTSEVEMRSASHEELVAYVAVGESLDKAGGYALQGEGKRFVLAVEGSRTNVIGLPLEETLELLEGAG
ncbi:MAG: septum formation protein Maf, partial [Deltaproteobacteria bacterium]|nr:septum formation protein Maf [Deltaproteobacteria bacterium]